METGFSFPRRERLKGRDEIRDVFQRRTPASAEPSVRGPGGGSGQRKSVSCAGAKLLTLRNGLPYNRIAFTFSRKFGKAVERNYSRRLSREAYRQLRNELQKGYDLVLLVYPGKDVYSVRMEQLRELFSRAGLFKESQ